MSDANWSSTSQRSSGVSDSIHWIKLKSTPSSPRVSSSEPQPTSVVLESLPMVGFMASSIQVNKFIRTEQYACVTGPCIRVQSLGGQSEVTQPVPVLSNVLHSGVLLGGCWVPCHRELVSQPNTFARVAAGGHQPPGESLRL